MIRYLSKSLDMHPYDFGYHRNYRLPKDRDNRREEEEATFRAQTFPEKYMAKAQRRRRAPVEYIDMENAAWLEIVAERPERLNPFRKELRHKI